MRGGQDGSTKSLSCPMPTVLVVEPQTQGSLASEPFQAWPGVTPGTATTFFKEPEGYRLRFPGIADFVLDDAAQTVTCIPVSPDVAWQAVHEQQVVPLLMAHRGCHVYHGGAVAVGDGAIAFIARSGQGKSTLVTALAARGFPFFSDDCLLVEEAPCGGVQVLPHAPSIRLWSDSLAKLAPVASELSHCPGSPKPRLKAGTQLPFAKAPLPLKRVYVLGDDRAEGVALVPLSPADTVLAWASNGFILDIKDRERLAANLRWAARMVASIPARRLEYPRRYERLDEVVAAVLADAGAVTA